MPITIKKPTVPDVAKDSDEIDIRMVEIDDIESNKWNPNEMEAEFFEALTSEVKANGMPQPILVRPHPECGFRRSRPLIPIGSRPPVPI
jgi:hypothetical protein